MHLTKRFCYISIKSVFVARNVETHQIKTYWFTFRTSTYVAAMLWNNTSKENERTCLLELKFWFKHNSILFFYYCVDANIEQFMICTFQRFYVWKYLVHVCFQWYLLGDINHFYWIDCIDCFVYRKSEYENWNIMNESRISINIFIHIVINVIFSRIPFHSFLIFLYYIILLFIDH